MKLILITILACLAIGLCGFASGWAYTSMQRPYTFYDGEGNTIPYHAVDSLVRLQYLNLSKEGGDTVNKYFKP